MKTIWVLFVMGVVGASSFGDDAVNGFLKSHGKWDEIARLETKVKEHDTEAKRLDRLALRVRSIQSALNGQDYHSAALWAGDEWEEGGEYYPMRKFYESKGIKFSNDHHGNVDWVTRNAIRDQSEGLNITMQSQINDERNKLVDTRNAVDRLKLTVNAEKVGEKLKTMGSDPANLSKTLTEFVQSQQVKDMELKLDDVHDKLELAELTLKDSLLSHYVQKKMEEVSKSDAFCGAVKACNGGGDRKGVHYDKEFRRTTETHAR